MTLILMCCRKTGTIFWNLIWAKKADSDGVHLSETSVHIQTFHKVKKASGHVSQYFGETEQGLRWQTLKDRAMYQRLVVGWMSGFCCLTLVCSTRRKLEQKHEWTLTQEYKEIDFCMHVWKHLHNITFSFRFYFKKEHVFPFYYFR